MLDFLLLLIHFPYVSHILIFYNFFTDCWMPETCDDCIRIVMAADWVLCSMFHVSCSMFNVMFLLINCYCNLCLHSCFQLTDFGQSGVNGEHVA